MRKLLTILMMMGLFTATSSHAQEWYQPRETGKPDLVKLGVGYMHIIDKDEDEELAGVAEYHWGHSYALGISPFVAGQVAVDGSAWAGLGIKRDFFFGDNFIFTPSVAPGLYRQGGGMDLGGAFEIRTGLELGYQFPTKGRASLELTHLSNAGLYDDNPGAETLTVNYYFPVSF